MKKVSKRRLHYGIVFPSLDNTHKYRLLDGIETYAKEHDIHLTAFFGTYEANNYDFASHYEPCFEAIKNSTTLDGVILFSGFIAHNVGTDVFVDYVHSISEHVPVVSIGVTIPGTYSVMVDNMTGMYSAVDHLIKVHGKKRIAVIKGPDGHPEAEARLLGYKKALSDNGIELDEKLLLPGSFTPMSGRDAVNELLDKRKVHFDAISCCDDEAALGAMKILTQRGMNVPGDISVTGFDDVEEASNHVPALSSVQQNFSKFGYIAGGVLRDAIEGKEVPDVTSVTLDFIIRHSCGCNEQESYKIVHQPEPREYELRRRRITDNLVLQFNIDSLQNELHKSLPFIQIDSAIIGLYHAPIEGGVADGDRSIDMLFGFDGEQKIFVKNSSTTPFPLSDYSTVENVDYERERRTLFFLPLFFVDEENGVALIAYDSFNPIDSYETLRRNISTAVKGASLLEKIQVLSITDELTGLLNRRGFFQYVYARILYLQREHNTVPVVLSIDMDGLKHINDTYGHAEGDIAISAFARLLKDAMREEDIIGRIGGDEFVIFSVIRSHDNIAKLENRIRAKFDEYNAQKKHPYDILGSIGAVVLNEPTNEGFDQAMLSADDVLYEEKQKKRAAGLTRA